MTKIPPTGWDQWYSFQSIGQPTVSFLLAIRMWRGSIKSQSNVHVNFHTPEKCWTEQQNIPHCLFYDQVFASKRSILFHDWVHYRRGNVFYDRKPLGPPSRQEKGSRRNITVRLSRLIFFLWALTDGIICRLALPSRIVSTSLILSKLS